jgi:hypothetical protein
VLIVLGCLLFRRVGWRRIGAAALACAIPVLGYMTAFYATFGQFTLTEGAGLFLWARTMSFADCAAINPPTNLVPLCRENQPGVPHQPAPAWSWNYLVTEPQPAAYLWDKRSWLWSGPHPGMNPQGNKRAIQFAMRAIGAQPLAYTRVVSRDVLLTFLNTDRALQFSTSPRVPRLPRTWRAILWRYGGTSANTHNVEPWAFLMLGYQQPVYFPGVAFALVMLMCPRESPGAGPAAGTAEWTPALAGTGPPWSPGWPQSSSWSCLSL